MQKSYSRYVMRTVLWTMFFWVGGWVMSALGYAANGKPETFFDYWNQGGPTMWPLLGSAVWATAVILECFIKLRGKYFLPPDTIRQLSDAMVVGDYQKAWRVGMENPTLQSSFFSLTGR